MNTSHDTNRHQHRMERTFEVTATPEQVWAAIATADGISTWMVPATLDPQIGGQVTFDLGGLVSIGVVTDYAPNHRFAYEEPWPISADAPIPDDMAQWFASIDVALSTVQEGLAVVTPLATEFLIEAASGA